MDSQNFWERDVADVDNGVSSGHVDAPGPAGADGTALSSLTDAVGQADAMERELSLSLSDVSTVEGYFKVRTLTCSVGFLFWGKM